jgi:hypothetical protein
MNFSSNPPGTGAKFIIQGADYRNFKKEFCLEKERKAKQSGPTVLFDLDGTLIDSVYRHILVWREALEQIGSSSPMPRSTAGLAGAATSFCDLTCAKVDASSV